MWIHPALQSFAPLLFDARLLSKLIADFRDEHMRPNDLWKAIDLALLNHIRLTPGFALITDSAIDAIRHGRLAFVVAKAQLASVTDADNAADLCAMLIDMGEELVRHYVDVSVWLRALRVFVS